MVAFTEMTPGEEHVCFYHEIGMAITQWAMVEHGLFLVVLACTHKSNWNQIGPAFFSIENFRSKLGYVDSLVQKKAKKKGLENEWLRLHKRIKNASEDRNWIAHKRLVISQGEQAGSRFALVTWTDDGRRVCVGEINKFRLQFSEITVSLHNFHARLLGQRRLFPKSEERVGRQMTTLELSSQIHAILGYKRPPSNRTLRREKEAKDAADGMNGGA